MSEATAAAVGGAVQQFPAALIPVSLIAPDPVLNPRTWFDPETLGELAESIKEQGIIEPLVVRPALEGEGYRLIAGDRRHRAAKLAGLEAVPCVIRDVNDAEALEIAGHENIHREDMSFADEALLARKILGRCDGDHDEACKTLAWKPHKLKARLLLLHAHPDVLKALTEKRIKVGHAELLAGLPDATQVGTLEKVIADSISVLDLKAKIAQFAMDLSKAIFDRGQCTNCGSNSDTQATLFEEVINSGRCQNRACYQEKTEAALSEKRKEYATEYSVVFLDTEKAPDQYTVLSYNDVGRVQARACRSCGNFGALLDTRPGSVGLETGELCFDLNCHAEKVAAYKRALEASGDTPQTAPTAEVDKTATTTAPKAAAGKGSKSGKSGKKGTGASVAKMPPAVLKVNYRQARAWARDTVLTDPHMQMALAIDALLDAQGARLPESASAELKTLCQREANETSRLERLFAASDTLLDEALRLVTAERVLNNASHSIMEEHAPRYSATVLKLHDCALAGRVVLNREYLDAHTKLALEDVLRGAGLPAWYDAKHGDGAFTKLMKGKKADVLTATETAIKDGFTVDAGYVPPTLAKLV